MKFIFLLFIFSSSAAHAVDRFSECLGLFANRKSPIVSPAPMQRDLCYDAFAILHSGESKTSIFVAEKLTKELLLNSKEFGGLSK